MTRLWRWIVVFWVICIGLPFAVPSHLFDLIRTPWYGDSAGFRAASAVIFTVALILLIRFPFRTRLPAVVAGGTAITAMLFVAGQIVYISDNSIGLGFFALSLFLGLLVIRAGYLYGEEISTTMESSNIHLSQAAEFLVVYLVTMIKFLPDQGMRDIGLFLLRILRDARPIVDQISRDFSQLLNRIMESIF